MKSKYFWPLLVLPMVLATELFGMLPVSAAPKLRTPLLKKPARPVVRLGKPYRAELQRKVGAGGLPLTFSCKADCSVPHFSTPGNK